MFKKLLRLAVILMLCAALGTSVTYFSNQPDRPMRDPAGTDAPAVKVVNPIDLNGTWRSEKPKVTATVLNGTIDVESITEDGGYVRWWYGTFDNPRDGKMAVISKGMEDPNKFYLSSAETKDFVYDTKEEILRFQLSVMGTTRIVEMKRVQG